MTLGLVASFVWGLTGVRYVARANGAGTRFLGLVVSVVIHIHFTHPPHNYSHTSLNAHPAEIMVRRPCCRTLTVPYALSIHRGDKSPWCSCCRRGRRGEGGKDHERGGEGKGDGKEAERGGEEGGEDDHRSGGEDDEEEDECALEGGGEEDERRVEGGEGEGEREGNGEPGEEGGGENGEGGGVRVEEGAGG